MVSWITYFWGLHLTILYGLQQPYGKVHYSIKTGNRRYAQQRLCGPRTKERGGGQLLSNLGAQHPMRAGLLPAAPAGAAQLDGGSVVLYGRQRNSRTWQSELIPGQQVASTTCKVWPGQGPQN